MSEPAAALRPGALTGHPYFASAGVLALACFIIGGAWAFQLIGGLQPCPLCLEQRVPWYLLIATGLGLVGAQGFGLPRAVRAGLFVVALGLLVWSAHGGLYHAGVEYKWWPGPTTCSSNGGTLDPTVPLTSLSSRDVIRCDVVPWSLFGISLAGFNFLFSLAGIGLAGLGLLRSMREKA